MTVGKANVANLEIGNLSWYRGTFPQRTAQNYQTDVVPGNPNRPVHLNNDPTRGPVVTKDWSF